MKCDNCGEDITRTVINRPDGEVWCHSCMKQEKAAMKNRKRARTNDAFVKIARRLSDVRRDEYPAARVILKGGVSRVYTNGHVLMSELLSTPEKYKLVDINSLWESGDVAPASYPAFENVLENGLPNGVVVNLPEEFYELLKAFNKPKPNMTNVVVRFERDGIRVTDERDGSSLWYGEVLSGVDEPVPFSYAYIAALKPRSLLLKGQKPAWVLDSHEKAVNSCVAVIVSPQRSN